MWACIGEDVMAEHTTQGFGFGIFDGVKDFFVEPYNGARKEGPLGFLKGVGKGIGSIATKPAAGTS